MDSTVAYLALMIRSLAGHTNRSPSTISRLVTGSGDTLRRLEARRPDGSAEYRISTERVGKAFHSLDDLWPSDLEWPREIPRPSKIKKKEAA